jgi:hypothetical protein
MTALIFGWKRSSLSRQMFVSRSDVTVLDWIHRDRSLIPAKAMSASRLGRGLVFGLVGMNRSWVTTIFTPGMSAGFHLLAGASASSSLTFLGPVLLS